MSFPVYLTIVAAVIVCLLLLNLIRTVCRKDQASPDSNDSASQSSVQQEQQQQQQQQQQHQQHEQQQGPSSTVIFSRSFSSTSFLPLYVPRSQPGSPPPEMSQVQQTGFPLSPPPYSDVVEMQDPKDAASITEETEELSRSAVVIAVPAAAHHLDSPEEGPSVSVDMP